jgi:hypothetical protein
MYKLVNFRGAVSCIQKQDGDVVLLIPFDPDNTDYQEYLKWLAEGNEPEPADE